VSNLPECPKCTGQYTYEDQSMYVCPECSHEWAIEGDGADTDSGSTFKDANGTPLSDGDSVTLIKDLKVKGSASKIKAGTKVKNIRLVEGNHDISCKIDGIGAMMLKSEFVKKA